MARQQTRSKQRKAVRPTVRWTAWLTSGGVILLLVALGVFTYDYLRQPGRLPLRVIDVNGEFQQLRRDNIQQTVVRVMDGGFFTCDMQKMRAAVLAMPWVEDVSIRRIWPDRLSMTVTEQAPLARWGDDALINVNGVVFRPDSLRGFDGLVRLRGPQGSQQRVVALLQAAVPAARARGLTVREVELDMRRHWWMKFDDALVVSLGDEDIENRLAQFFRVYPNLVADPLRRPQRVDMRYAHGFAVQWRELPAQEEAAAMTGQGIV